MVGGSIPSFGSNLKFKTMTKEEIIEYEIWRKTLPMTIRKALGPSDMASLFIENNISDCDDCSHFPCTKEREKDKISYGRCGDHSIRGE